MIMNNILSFVEPPTPNERRVETRMPPVRETGPAAANEDCARDYTVLRRKAFAIKSRVENSHKQNPILWNLVALEVA